MKLFVKHGTEGSAYDPYSYTERTVITTDGCSYTLHTGLVTYVKAGDTVLDLHENSAEQVFEVLTGLNARQFDKAKEKIDYTCKHCGNRKSFRYEDGFPGETLAICTRCNHIVSCFFDISAIE